MGQSMGEVRQMGMGPRGRVKMDGMAVAIAGKKGVAGRRQLFN